MRKPVTAKNTQKIEIAPQKKPVKPGPVELTPADMKKVSGGLPCSWPKPTV